MAFLKKKKRGISCIAVLLFVLCCTFGVNAYYSYILHVTNHLEIGDVRIEITEEMEQDGERVPFQNGQTVLPSDTISKIPSIRSLAEPCYVRYRIEGKMGHEILMDLEERLGGMNPEWIRIGAYYYRTKPLVKGESSELFKTFSLPAEWGNETAEQKVTLTIYAEAVQSAFFEPDFESEVPWGDIAVMRCVHTETYGESEGEKAVLEIELTEEAKDFVKTRDDFFESFGNLMPGGTYTDHVMLKNASEDAVEMYFHEGLDCPLEDAYMKALLRRIRLKLILDGKTVYRGPLYDEVLLKEKSLGILQAHTEKKLEFELYVPKELNNLYALRKAHLRWYFSVYNDEGPLVSFPGISQTPEPEKKPEAEKTPQPTKKPGEGAGTDTEKTADQEKDRENGGIGTKNGTGGAAEETTKVHTGSVQTGDDQPVKRMTALLAAAASVSVMILLLKKGESDEKE